MYDVYGSPTPMFDVVYISGQNIHKKKIIFIFSQSHYIFYNKTRCVNSFLSINKNKGKVLCVHSQKKINILIKI